MQKLQNALIAVLIVFSVSPAYGQLTIDQQEKLKSLSDEYRLIWQNQRQNAEIRAKAEGIPMIRSQQDGQTLELQRYERGIPIYYSTENINAAATTSTNKVWKNGGAGFELSGDGIILGIWDGGAVLVTHRELSGRAVQSDKAAQLNWHSTHVAGTMIAAGITAEAKGMAYAASLHANDWNSDNAEMSAQAAAGLRVSNHSYGTITGWRSNYLGDGKWAWFGDPAMASSEDYKFGYYDSDARAWDEISYNAPYYLIVKSAGNDRGEGPGNPAISHWERRNNNWILSTESRELDGGNEGYDCIPTNGNAKNILTVGAAEDIPGGYTNPSDVVLTSFSGCGPTDDGRVKPDIVGNGRSLYSCTSTSNSAYTTSSGTSMSSPNVAGSLGLLLQHHDNLHPGMPLRASTLKAIVLHTADEAGDAGPDYKYGWGLLNTAKAAKLMKRAAEGDGVNIIEEVEITDLKATAIQVYSPGRGPLRVTICWTDPAGAVPAPSVDPDSRTLVNDIDLRVEAPDLSQHMPWVLDPLHPSAQATRGDNIVDNVEQVLIETPVEGYYTIRVGKKGTLTGGTQIVSVVISVSDEPSLFSPPFGLTDVSLTPSLQWNFMNGASSYHVQIAKTADFKNPIVNKSDVYQSYYIPAALEQSTQYFWRVRLIGTQGNSDWSEIRAFTTGGEETSAGHALYLDGVDDYAEFGHNTGFNQIEANDRLSIEAWINIASWYNGYFSIIDKYNTNLDFGWLFQIHSTSGFNFIGSEGVDCAFTPSLNTWYHVAMTYDKAEGFIRFYVNGELRCSSPFDSDIRASDGGPLYIGYNPSGGDEYSRGMIDEVRIWKTIRTPDEIRSNMNARILETDPDLVALCRFDKGTGFKPLNAADNTEGSLKNGAVWLISQVPVQVPAKPVLMKPSPGTTNVALKSSYIWSSCTGSESYRVQIARDNTFGNPLYDQSIVRQTSTDGPLLQEETTYYWRVRGINSRGAGQWSDAGMFKTAEAPPPAPVLLSPVNKALDIQVNTDILWNPAPRATTYLVQVSPDSMFDENSAGFIVNTTDQITTSVRAENLGNSTTYFWRAAGRNAGGTGPWSDVWRFTTVPAPPLAPVLLTPLNHAKAVADNPVFTWEKSEYATLYRFQIAEDSAFANILFERADLPLPTYGVSGLDPAKTYFWHVQAINSAGASPWSEAWRFTTVRPVPAAPAPVAPSDSATGVPLRALLQWNRSSYADSYSVQVSRGATFSDIVFQANNIADSMIVAGELAENTAFVWRINAKNETGTSVWSETRTFSTGERDIEPTILISPANSSQMVDVNPLFRWHQTAGAEGYTIQVSKDDTFQSGVTEKTSIADTATSGFAFEEYTQYFWRVRGYTSKKTGPWSEIRNFTTKIPLPSPVTLLMPLNKTLILTDSIRFIWSASTPNVTAYQLQRTKPDINDSLALNDPALSISDSIITDTTYFLNGQFSLTYVWWRVRAKNAAGWGPWSLISSYSFEYVGIEPVALSGDGFALSWAYPNPVRAGGSTTVTFGARKEMMMQIELIDATGRSSRIVDRLLCPAGVSTYVLPLDGVPPGQYFISVRFGLSRLTKPVTVIR